MTPSIEFQGRTFAAPVRDDGLHEVRYTHKGRGVIGRVASADLDRLPKMLAVQSAAMGGTQLLPRGA